jgi:CcmD family protein
MTTRSRFAAVWLVFTVLAFGALHGGALPVIAQASPAVQAQPPANPQGEFVPVKDLPDQEKLPAAPLLIAAYVFAWVALLVYVWTVWRRLMKVERDVKDLNTRLTTKPGRS